MDWGTGGLTTQLDRRAWVGAGLSYEYMGPALK